MCLWYAVNFSELPTVIGMAGFFSNFISEINFSCPTFLALISGHSWHFFFVGKGFFWICEEAEMLSSVLIAPTIANQRREFKQSNKNLYVRPRRGLKGTSGHGRGNSRLKVPFGQI